LTQLAVGRVWLNCSVMAAIWMNRSLVPSHVIGAQTPPRVPRPLSLNLFRADHRSVTDGSAGSSNHLLGQIGGFRIERPRRNFLPYSRERESRYTRVRLEELHPRRAFLLAKPRKGTFMSAPRSTHSSGPLRVVLTVLGAVLVLTLALATPGTAAASADIYHDRTSGPSVHGHRATMIDLGTLGGTYSDASAINDRGQVTGYAYPAGGYSHAFRWTASGGMQDLGTLGGTDSSASAINDCGQVTGTANTADGDGDSHAFVWTP